VIGRDSRKGKVVGVDRYSALRLNHGKQNVSRRRIDFLDRYSLMLRQPFEDGYRQVQFFTEMRSEK
jgi:hypothetical protein